VQQSKIHFIAENVIKCTDGHLEFQKFSQGINPRNPTLKEERRSQYESKSSHTLTPWPGAQPLDSMERGLKLD